MRTAFATLLAIGALAGAAYLYIGADRPVRVAVVQVERGDVADVLVTNGRVEAGDRFDIYSETGGRVLRVVVNVGDVVRQGAVLATIDDRAARAELAQAAARADAARAEIAVWDKGPSEAERAELRAQITGAEVQRRGLLEDLDRVKRLIDKHAAPRVEATNLERRVADLDREIEHLRGKPGRKPPAEGRQRLEAQLREAEAGVALAQRQLGSAEVRSPIAGTVYALEVRAGDFVNPGVLVARVAGSAEVQAVLYIDEPELGRVRLGQRATLTADAFPGQSWTCSIGRLPTEVVELETRRVGEVRCRVEGEPGRLIPNLTVSARIPSASALGVASLPREALQRTGKDPWVWTVDAESRARRTPVETGVRGDARVEIRAGVALGDRVLLPGAEALREGDPVQEAR